MQGYCPTHANQAPANAPRAPQIAWSVTPLLIDEPEDFLPAEVVVDPAGRAYVAINASAQNPRGGPNSIYAIDPDGSIAWTTTFSSTVSSLALAKDGHLWLMGMQGAEPSDPACQNGGGPNERACVASLSALSPEGAVVQELDVSVQQPSNAPPVGYETMALASDGSFFLEGRAGLPDFGSSGGLARLASNGTAQWQQPSPVAAASYTLLPPLMVGPRDGVIASNSGDLVAFDAAGDPLWQWPVGALTAGIDGAGNIVALSSGSPSGDVLSLITLDPAGHLVRTVSLGAPEMTFDDAQLALAGDGTTVVLLVNGVGSSRATEAEVQLTAIDAAGTTRWTTKFVVTIPSYPAALAAPYGMFVDGAGTVVVTAGAIEGVDLATGTRLWSVQPPHADSCLRPAVLGAGGAVLASQCDGTVFLARDP